jgi:hypothetical protein
MKSIGAIMEEAANLLLTAMNRDDATITEKTKMFDSLTEYYKSNLKVNGKAEPADVQSFSQIRERIRDESAN